MENLLNKDSVKRVKKFIKKFDPQLNVIVLETTARGGIGILHTNTGNTISQLRKLGF